MDRYFDTPDAKFDLDIFGEIFDVLIKYNDREAVKMFWSLMEEMQVEPDPEMREKVCFYSSIIMAEQSTLTEKDTFGTDTSKSPSYWESTKRSEGMQGPTGWKCPYRESFKK